MLVVQHNCGQGYESIIMALETAFRKHRSAIDAAALLIQKVQEV